MAETILYDLDADGVATLTLNRPEKRNAFDSAMVDAWHERLVAFGDDDNARVLIVTGAGTAFCAGGDTGSMAERANQNGLERKNYLWRKVHRIHRTMSDLDKPVIAAINGSARGAGLDMALCCDFRLMAASATVAETYIHLGLSAGNGGAWFLPRLVGMQQALAMLLTGRVVDAQEAKAIGLVLDVVPDDELQQRALELAREIAEKPVEAVRILKRLA